MDFATSFFIGASPSSPLKKPLPSRKNTSQSRKISLVSSLCSSAWTLLARVLLRFSSSLASASKPFCFCKNLQNTSISRFWLVSSASFLKFSKKCRAVLRSKTGAKILSKERVLRKFMRI